MRAFLTACALWLLAACGDGSTAPAEGIFGRGTVHWFIPDTVGAGPMQPLRDGPRVYFSRDLPLSPSGSVLGTPELRAFDWATGAVLWKGPITSAQNAAVAGNVVGAVWGSLPMFERTSGMPTRVFSYGSTSLSGNVVSDGTRFYVGSHNGHVLALEPLTGGVQWDRDLAGGPSTTVFGLALSGDALAVTLKYFRPTGTASDSGIVAVLDRATGAQRWRVAIGGGENAGIVEAPVIIGGLVIAVTQALDVHAFDLQTGAPRWHRSVAFTVDGYSSNGLTACEDIVIAPTADLGLVALDAVTGATRWRLGDLGAGSLSRVECSYGTILILGSGRLQIVDARTGARRADYPEGSRSDATITSATRDEGSLYVATSVGFARVVAP